jgi:hypothetical protein
VQGERPVKPSAQPTLVRTQHLPPPAKTARWLRILAVGGPFFSVPPCITLCRCRPWCRGVHGRMADGICARGRSVCTVGCFTDGHGRAAVAARFLAVTLQAAAWRSCPTSPPAAAMVPGLCEELSPTRSLSCRLGPFAADPAASARPSTPSAAPADFRTEDARFRACSCSGLRCTFRVPHSYPASAGGRRTRQQTDRSVAELLRARRTRSAVNAWRRARRSPITSARFLRRCGAVPARRSPIRCASTARARSGHAAYCSSRLAWIAEAPVRTWPALPYPH